MARPFKSGLDYFPLDVHDDDKMKFIRIKFKIIGAAIVFELYRKIYCQGFFTMWSNDEALILSDSIKAEFKMVQDVVSECLLRGIFDNAKYTEFGVLTSKGIQDRFAEATLRRKNARHNFDFLVNDSKMYRSRGVYVDSNLVIDNINPSSGVVNGGKSTQSKVKESKVKKSKELKDKDLSENEVSKPPKKTKRPLPERKYEFEDSVGIYTNKYPRTLLVEFCGYWTEHGPNDKKMRFEKETSWDLNRRLGNWDKKSRAQNGKKEQGQQNNSAWYEKFGPKGGDSNGNQKQIG